MTRTKHPDNRFARRQLEVKRNAKKQKEDREGHVWRKLETELLKEREINDDLREAAINFSGHPAK